ncbi:ABC transporter permease [Pseudorhodoplanes sp.]|uniref:ABC transporter permease n=1 Tax=Pseudorhodoplanes sp. TaxID=1934341 RepID=UPI003D0B2B0D
MLRRSAGIQTASFILSRLRGAIVIVFGVSLLVFALARTLPGDPARLALGPAASPEQVQALRLQMGLDRPFFEQYWIFLKGASRLDFGVSLYTNRPVAQDLARALPATLELALAAGVIMIIFGLLLGIASARWKDRWFDNLLRPFTLLSVAMPNFVWAIIFVLILSFWFGLFPIAGRLSERLTQPPFVTGLLTVDAIVAGRFDVLRDALHHLVLPAIALSLPGIAQVSRLTRANMVESYMRPYVEFARAYGFPEREIACKWALRPALIPTFTLISMQIVLMLGNAFLIETVFAWPGMARYGVEAILRKDLNSVVAVVMVFSLAFILVNIFIDAFVALIDPRIRYRG